LAGHSDIATTRKYYLMARPDDIIAAGKVVSEIMGSVKSD
jgi:hypothetical protein